MNQNIANSLKRLEENLGELESITGMVNRTLGSYDNIKSKIEDYISELDGINTSLNDLSSSVKAHQQNEATQFEQMIKSTLSDAEASAKNFASTVEDLSTRMSSWKAEINHGLAELLDSQQKSILAQTEQIINTIQNFSRSNLEKMDAVLHDVSGKTHDISNNIQEVLSSGQSVDRNIQGVSDKAKAIENAIQELAVEIKKIAPGLEELTADIIEKHSISQKNLSDLLKEQDKKIAKGISAIKTVIVLCFLFTIAIVGGAIYAQYWLK